ncbi:MAG: hypothetical protein J5849_02320 [Clostridia bacterium]|nr:hypothetical protein [Clostridia bacterium]
MTFAIPAPLELIVDDVGWFHGSDDRPFGGSARTGISRNHVAADYEALDLLGRKSGVKLLAAFVLGEWDPDDRLKDVPCLSKYGDRWHNAALLDREEAERCAAVVRSSPWIEIAVHGLMHNYYLPGAPYGNSDYYFRRDGVLRMIGRDEVRRRLDAFFDLLDYWDFHKPVRAFVPPNFVYRWGEIAEILREYGILYASTVFADGDMEVPDGPRPVDAGVDRGVIVLDRKYNPIRRKELGADPSALPAYPGVFGCHWPNLLAPDPAENAAVVEKWALYFERAKKEFDLILPEDIAFAATQALIRRFASLREETGGCRIDLSAVPAAEGRIGRFVLRSRKALSRGEGCAFSPRDAGPEFFTYDVFPQREIFALFP